MIVDIQTRRLRTIGQLRAFVEGNEAVDFQPRDREEAYEQMSGLATREVLRRQFEVFGDARFERLATISNGHVYNLRGSATYRAKRTVWTKTQGTAVAIGPRQAPEPEGRPGHVRVDTVHQGDRDGVKGLYLINLVDEVTQYEFVGAVAGISVVADGTPLLWVPSGATRVGVPSGRIWPPLPRIPVRAPPARVGVPCRSPMQEPRRDATRTLRAFSHRRGKRNPSRRSLGSIASPTHEWVDLLQAFQPLPVAPPAQPARCCTPGTHAGCSTWRTPSATTRTSRT